MRQNVHGMHKSQVSLDILRQSGVSKQEERSGTLPLPHAAKGGIR